MSKAVHVLSRPDCDLLGFHLSLKCDRPVLPVKRGLIPWTAYVSLCINPAMPF